jgi:pimeloyl-ACP methyl ester carboxylesterase
LVICGEGDRSPGAEPAGPDRADVPDPDRVERPTDASHWRHQDEPERVTRLLADLVTPVHSTGIR